jgi:hypothetical protein
VSDQLAGEDGLLASGQHLIPLSYFPDVQSIYPSVDNVKGQTQELSTIETARLIATAQAVT